MNRSRGFTLIEVMLAATLLALLMVAVLAAMRTFGNTRATLDQVTARADKTRAVSEFLRSSIGSAMPVIRHGEVGGDVETDNSHGTYFVGDSAELVWVAPFVAGADLGGAFIMHLARVGDTLELRWHPYQRDTEQTDWTGSKPRVLLDSVEEFEIGYLPRNGDEWISQWSGDQYNPLLVRINIRAEGHYWPELVMHLGGARLNLR